MELEDSALDLANKLKRLEQARQVEHNRARRLEKEAVLREQDYRAKPSMVGPNLPAYLGVGGNPVDFSRRPR